MFGWLKNLFAKEKKVVEPECCGDKTQCKGDGTCDPDKTVVMQDVPSLEKSCREDSDKGGVIEN
jgi:hypothetical protein